MQTALRHTLAAAALGLAGTASAGDAIDYPDGYRLWAHVKTMALHPDHPLADPFLGIHHVYANLPAVRGLRTDDYPDGAVFVFDQLAWETGDGASVEGDRVLVGVMVKDRARFPKTGGWGFEGFAGDSRSQRLVDDGGASCFGCHVQVEDRGYVFSRWRD
jgi:hypothetical protein